MSQKCGVNIENFWGQIQEPGIKQKCKNDASRSLLWNFPEVWYKSLSPKIGKQQNGLANAKDISKNIQQQHQQMSNSNGKQQREFKYYISTSQKCKMIWN